MTACPRISIQAFAIIMAFVYPIGIPVGAPAPHGLSALSLSQQEFRSFYLSLLVD
jgi:hypothetical protein